MIKNLSKIFLSAIIVCIILYIGIFIGRTTTKNTLHISGIEQHKQEESNIFINYEKIDLNQATVNDLTEIPGVTASVANAIIEYRDNFGHFYRVRELLNVVGVSEELYNTLQKYVTVND